MQTLNNISPLPSLTALNALRSLAAERESIHEQLKPLDALLAAKRQDQSAMLENLAAASSNLDAAVKNAATVAAKAALRLATEQEAMDANKVRQQAQKAHTAAQTQSTGLHQLETEIAAFDAVGHEHALKLVSIEAQAAVLRENYLRALADESAAVYAENARALAKALAEVMAANQALALAEMNPDLLTPLAWVFSVSTLNSPSATASNGGGVLVDIDRVRLQQPAAFEALKTRIVADGVTIPGL